MSVRLKNNIEVQQVLQFLSDNQTLLNQFVKTNKEQFHPTDFILEPGTDVAYTPSKNKSSLISYGASSIPFYVWALMAFISYKKEVKNTKGEYFFYYDDERLKIDTFKTLPSEITSKHFCILEGTGEPIPRKQSILKDIFSSNDEKKVVGLIRELNTQWEKYDWNKSVKNKKGLSV